MNLVPEKTIYLIDASSYLYRAYYSIKPLSTPSGESVNAVFGFCRMLKKLIDMFSPHYCALVWDSKGKTERHEEYPAYKQTRQAPPSDLFTQKDRIIQIAETIGLHQVQKVGIEADDLLYSLAKDFAQQGFSVVVVSGDKDLGQLLVHEGIYLYDPLKETMYDRVSYEQKIGMPVDCLLTYFSLLGDASDNIPGVAGIGEKSALALVAAHATLENIYAHIDEIEPKRVRTALQANKENAFLSRDLFKLRYYAHVVSVSDVVFDEKNWLHAQTLFKELNFKSLIASSETLSSYADKLSYWKERCDVKPIVTEDALIELCKILIKVGAFACDTETDGNPPLACALVGLSVCFEESKAYYIPCGHTTGEQQLSIEAIVRIMGPVFADESCKKYFHNTKFDQKVLSQYGIIVNGIAHDTMIAASLVVPDGQKVGLKSLSEYYFNETMISFSDLVDGKKIKTFAQISLYDGMWYAAIDARQTLKLVAVLEPLLVKNEMVNLYTYIELPVTQVLCAMEMKGIFCDTQVLDELRIAVASSLIRLEEEICHAAGLLIPINFNSPKQVQDLLFNQLKLPKIEKSASGDQSTKHSVLVELAPLHPVPRLLLEHRELSKLKNTYIDALPETINPRTGRIHTTYNQIGVATGRLSSTDPNLQNIPVGNFINGLTVRAAFKASPGCLFISADYSQIELRVLAYLTQDPVLLEAFRGGHDIHQETAAYLFEVSPELVTHEQRQTGKRINFSVLYGVTPYGLSRDIKVPLAEAKQYIDRYFNTYKGVATWMEAVIERTKKDGYVTTHWGRRRSIPAIHERNKVLYQEACRVAINTIAQGTAAEIMKRAMIALAPELEKITSRAAILLQIHDEILVEVPLEYADQIDFLVKETLEKVVDWNIALTVTTRRGADWQAVSK